MLACPQLHHYPRLSFSTSFLLPLRQNSNSILPAKIQLPQKPASATTHSNSGSKEQISGTSQQCSNSTSFLLRTPSPRTPENKVEREEGNRSLSPEEKLMMMGMSLIRKRTPTIPDSMYAQSPSATNANSSSSPIVKFDDYREGDIDLIMRAVKIRRKVTAEIFKEAMAKGKFGITYSTNLVGKLVEFIDYVMIEAANKKREPEFSQSSFNLRAKFVIEESGVVPLVRWLKDNLLSYPEIGKLICMSRGNLASIRHHVEWLKTLQVQDTFIGGALMKGGDVFLERSREELDRIVGYLESKGIRKEQMGHIISRCPQLLSKSMDELITRVEFFLGIGMKEKDFGMMVFDYPKVLGYFTLEEMNQKVNYLKEFDLGNEDVGRLLAIKPQLMGCSIEENWKPLVKYFYYLGISQDGMRRILTVKPMIFCANLETTIVPKVRLLQELGIRDDAVGRMLVKFPPILTYSLHKKICPVVIFLTTKAGVAPKDIAKVISLGPELLGSSIENKLEISVQYFLSIGISVQQLGEMIAGFPLLLRYNVDLLHPKYRYLRRTMVRPLRDLIEFPRYFSYSLKDRIIPRHNIMVANRVSFKLFYMLASSDEEFEARVNAAVERRQRVESESSNGCFLTKAAADEFKGDEECS